MMWLGLLMMKSTLAEIPPTLGTQIFVAWRGQNRWPPTWQYDAEVVPFTIVFL